MPAPIAQLELGRDGAELAPKALDGSTLAALEQVTETLDYVQQQVGPRLAFMDFPELRAGSPPIWSSFRLTAAPMAILERAKSADLKGSAKRQARDVSISRELLPDKPPAVPGT